MRPNYMKPIGLSNSARLNVNNISSVRKPSSVHATNTEATINTDPAPSTLLQLSKDALMRRVRDLQNENRALLREIEMMKKQREDVNGNRATRQRSSSAPVSFSNSPSEKGSNNVNMNCNSGKENKENMLKSVRSLNESTSLYSVDLESSPDEPASCMRRVQSNLNESHTCARETHNYKNNNKNGSACLEKTEAITTTAMHVDPEGEMTVRGSVDLNNEYYLRESIQLAEHTRQISRRSSCLLSPERDQQNKNIVSNNDNNKELVKCENTSEMQPHTVKDKNEDEKETLQGWNDKAKNVKRTNEINKSESNVETYEPYHISLSVMVINNGSAYTVPFSALVEKKLNLHNYEREEDTPVVASRWLNEPHFHHNKEVDSNGPSENNNKNNSTTTNTNAMINKENVKDHVNKSEEMWSNGNEDDDVMCERNVRLEDDFASAASPEQEESEPTINKTVINEELYCENKLGETVVYLDIVDGDEIPIRATINTIPEIDLTNSNDTESDKTKAKGIKNEQVQEEEEYEEEVDEPVPQEPTPSNTSILTIKRKGKGKTVICNNSNNQNCESSVKSKQECEEEEEEEADAVISISNNLANRLAQRAGVLRNDKTSTNDNNNNKNNKKGLIDELFLLLASQDEHDIELEADAIVSQQTLRLLHKKIINYHQHKEEEMNDAVNTRTNTSSQNKVMSVDNNKNNTNTTSSSLTSFSGKPHETTVPHSRRSLSLSPLSYIRHGGVHEPTSPLAYATAIYHYLVKKFAIQNGCEHQANDIEGFGRALISLCKSVTSLLDCEPRHGQIHSPCYVFGDIHGNFRDLFYFMDNLISFQDLRYTPHRFLFLGDYVDRGEFSVEVIAYLFALKTLVPHKVLLLRGNHEDTLVSGDISSYGACSFRAQCHSLFGLALGEEVWHTASISFASLPLSASIDQRIFCVHGGIPRYNNINMNNSNPVMKNNDNRMKLLCDPAFPKLLSFFEVPDHESKAMQEYRQIGMDVCWADPAENESKLNSFGFGNNPRGSGVILFGTEAVNTFLDHFHYDLIFRAHQEKCDGLKLSKSGKVFTIFSTSGYVGHNNGAGVVLVADNTIRLIVKNADTFSSEEEEEEEEEDDTENGKAIDEKDERNVRQRQWNTEKVRKERLKQVSM